ncbi:hypothetical protein CERSUDRAFT_83981 [Gelatoporia subvermispora B]|uniref:CFEM domain-containing protein n=1 Tax=Ceriporiopsis subvermispora (strain B) TaxID=914234 RepID=M2RDT5_CERS8|nr:hypothetical protein CERSUDRAFT_83981 [Gelatoporia subvermispora B]
MRFSLAVLALATVASASIAPLSKRQFPDCAENCLVDADFGSCSQTDDVCLCNSSAFVNSVTSCITSSCTGSDLTTAEGEAVGLCAAVGVNLSSDVPSASASPSGASSSGSAAAASSTSGSSSGSASSGSSGSTAPAPTNTGNGAAAHGMSALAGLLAVGVAAFSL